MPIKGSPPLSAFVGFADKSNESVFIEGAPVAITFHNGSPLQFHNNAPIEFHNPSTPELSATREIPRVVYTGEAEV